MRRGGPPVAGLATLAGCAVSHIIPSLAPGQPEGVGGQRFQSGGLIRFRHSGASRNLAAPLDCGLPRSDGQTAKPPKTKRYRVGGLGLSHPIYSRRPVHIASAGKYRITGGTRAICGTELAKEGGCRWWRWSLPLPSQACWRDCRGWRRAQSLAELDNPAGLTATPGPGISAYWGGIPRELAASQPHPARQAQRRVVASYTALYRLLQYCFQSGAG